MLFLILSLVFSPVVLAGLWLLYKVLYFQISRALCYRHIPRMAAPAMTLLTTDLDSDKDFHIFFDALRDSPNTFHPIVDCGVYPDGTVAIAVSDPTAVKTVLQDVKTFPKHPVMTEPLMDIIGEGLVTSKHNAHWKESRKVVKPLFLHGNLLGIEEFVEKNGNAIMDRIRNNLDKEHNMKLVFSEMALSIIIDFVFGGNFPVKELSVIYNKVLEAMPAWCVGVALGGKVFKHSPLPWATRTRALSKQLYALVHKAMADREQKGVEQGKNDLLNLFYSYRTKDGKPLSKEHIADEALTFLAAGHETTSNGVAWALYYTLQNPWVYEMVRAELDEYTSAGKPISLEARSELKFLGYVFEETLRIKPPVPLLDRMAAEKTTLCGKTIPKGTPVFVPIEAIHTDGRYWYKPMEFLPHRWAKPEELESWKEKYPNIDFPSLERSKSDPPLTAPGSFWPFSGGPRKCVGQIIARYEAQMILAKMFHAFDIEQVKKDKPVISRFEGTLAPENFYAKFKIRK